MSTLSLNEAGVLVSADTDNYAITKLDTDKYLYVYSVGTSLYAAVVTTINNVIVINTGYLVEAVNGLPSACTLSTTKAVIEYNYYSANYFGKCVIANINGTVITFGTIYTYLSTTLTGTDIITYSETEFILVYSNNNSINGIICTVSANVISYGSSYMFGSGGGRITINNYTTDKWVLTYHYYGSSIYTPRAMVMTRSGATLSGGTAYTIYADSIAGGAIKSVMFANNTRLAVIHNIVGATNNYPVVSLCTLSGNVVTVNSYTALEGTTISSGNSNVLLVSANRLFVVYDDTTHNTIKLVLLDISGNSVTKSNLTTFSTSSIGPNDRSCLESAMISSSKFIVIYQDPGNSNYATSILGAIVDGKRINGIVLSKWDAASISKWNNQ